MNLPQFYIDDIIKRAVTEDINYIDVATDYLIPDDSKTAARLVAKAEGVVCGIDVAKRVFTLLDEESEFCAKVKDGARVNKGDIIATVTGKTSALLKGERTALNLLCHMSGIATATNECVKLVEGTNAS
ncbi:MAG: nicotinate-nucleotide diphosphorylase, partial [Oscillospiraceae bacterium]